MRYYCTYFDSKYLSKGLALYQSLRRHCCEEFTLWVLCFDDRTYQVLQHLDLSGMRLISSEEFEHSDSELLQAKQNRSRVEYYWTSTPSLLLYVLAHTPEIEMITYLDADLYFYSDPTAIYQEFGEGSILITEHRYAS